MYNTHVYMYTACMRVYTYVTGLPRMHNTILRPSFEHGFVTHQDYVKTRHKPLVFETLDTALHPAMAAIRSNALSNIGCG